MSEEPLKPLRKDECLRIASLFYALGVGAKLERLTKAGHWVPDFCSNRSVARYPWRHRVKEHARMNETLTTLIHDAEDAEGSDEVIHRCRESGDAAATEINRLRQEKAELLEALKRLCDIPCNCPCEIGVDEMTAYGKARAAIDKAERRQP